ncbi:uncharacterized protein LOC143265292 [Megachile rotundata]|uniref:uncharacterized protein LOC143265292 n=1 Tax=Megachile rotundata TaxID=143995 RepID=UPI003FD2FE83
MATSSEEILRKLVEERGYLKSSLTKFKTFCDTHAKTTTVDSLQERLNRCVPLIDKFEKIQDQIESLVTASAEKEQHIQYRDAFETLYFDLIGGVRGYIQRLNNPNANRGVQQPVGNTAASPALSVASASVKLPSIPLPTFHGSLGEWVYFRDSFESLINQNETLSNIERLHYLKSAVKGEAARALEALAMSDNNYTAAWALLRDRYEDSNELIDFHVGALFNLQSTTRDSPMSLRRLIDDFNNHLRSLVSLQEPVDKWDTLLVYLLSSKLDLRTRESWEKRVSELGSKKTLADLRSFLEQHYKFLAKSVRGNTSSSPSPKCSIQKPQSRPVSFVATECNKCPLCSSEHTLVACKTFKALTVNARRSKVKELRVCFNCLRTGHGFMTCTQGSCHKCKSKHHTLLHYEKGTVPVANPVVVEKPVDSGESKSDNQSYIVHCATNSDVVLLSTAIIHVIDDKGKRHECRALLDQGSQVNLLKEGFAKQVGLTWEPTTSVLSGVGAVDSGKQVIGKAHIRIASQYNGFRANLSCLVMPKVTADIPNFKLPRSLLQIPSHIQLADPHFDVPRDVDMIIGNGHLWDIMSVGCHRLGPGLPILMKTQMGWVFGGRFKNSVVPQPQVYNVVTNDELSKQLTQFWEVETISTNEELLSHPCEEHFIRTVTRHTDGRFIVQMPVTDDVKNLGNSEVMAANRFRNLERKLAKSPALRLDYVGFIREYIALGHMSKVSRHTLTNACLSYYLPHHAVIKETSTTTRVRVVFDGSAKTSTGISLNDVQRVGPVVQDDLFSILVRFRQHRVVVSADIEKMYRQILVSPEQRSLQRILWREDPSQPLDVYELNTVTYGTASAPFLATRCLRQVGLDNIEKYPDASRVIIKDFYVDDLLTGADSVEEAQVIKRDVEQLLDTVGFKLRKWASNEATVFQNSMDKDKRIVSQKEEDPRTLGILWSPVSDDLRIVSSSQVTTRVTKRVILSHLSKIFDPLGLVGPVVIRAKLMMQSLWQLGIGWDESVPQQIYTEFQEFQGELESLSRLLVPRFVLGPNPVQVDLHGFCDASEKAFGACVYLRTIDQGGHITVRLLCAKSRVAPLKTISLPRLELCAALLLIQIICKIRTASKILWNSETYWTDSTITLAWIQGSSNRWKTFVANRVTEIQNSSQGIWQHVASQHNPADCLSRGVRPSTLESLDLWWNGPLWLRQGEEGWPVTGPLPLSVPEEKSVVLTVLRPNNSFDELLTRYSSYTRLIRIVAYCLKFYHAICCRRSKKINKPCSEHTVGHICAIGNNLTVQDLNLAEEAVLRLLQQQYFMQEILDLQSNRDIFKSSSLRGLNPLLDKKGLLRVGGRLNFANLKYEQQHPVILPKDSFITKLIIRREHERLLHAGCESVLSAIRRKYWPLSGRNTIKGIIRKCVRCSRTNPKGVGYLMGQLPAARVQVRAPFFTTGVDYAGPFYVKERNRSKTTTKAYLCLFVCLATKAVHFELSVDLTTNAFLNCLRRFVARRGKCKQIFSDNGTNFVGARNEMQRMEQFFRDEVNQRHILDFTVTEGIDWHFIPPHAPHFGGLWESAVKSAKRHLLRVIGETRLTFEELYTVLTQIEACMNSRPLHPISSDPKDLTPLTPGHFLTGGPLSDIPYPDVTDVKANRLSRFQLLQAMQQHFWRRWQTDYLHQLQQRNKWKVTVPEKFGPGTMVVIKEDNLPLLRWRLGRITEVHPGKDGVSRVVSIRTADGIIKRPVAKICILPVDDSATTDQDSQGAVDSTSA